MSSVSTTSSRHAKDWLEKKYGQNNSDDSRARYSHLERACRCAYPDWDTLMLSKKIKKYVKYAVQCFEKINDQARQREQEKETLELQQHALEELKKQWDFEAKILTMNDDELLHLWTSDDPEVTRRLALSWY